VIIEDRIRDWEAERGVSPRSCPAAKAVAKFPAPLTSSVPQENSRASQLNCIRRANEPVSSHKIHGRDREIWQVKSPNSVIKTHPNLLKINDGDILKSPKNQILQDHELRACESIHGPRMADRGSRLTGSALQTEFDVTHRKQTTEKFLTGARTHISETHFAQHPATSPLGFPK
jgi:hypothetical protein